MSKRVVIKVVGGQAYVIEKEQGCTVFIIDQDNIDAGDSLEEATEELGDDVEVKPPPPRILQPHERTRRRCKELEDEARAYVARMNHEPGTTCLQDVGAAAMTWLYGEDYWAWEERWGAC